jgi:hypothetical protein
VFAKEFRCPECGGSEGYRSRRRSFLERYFFPLVFLQPVRCVNCYRRTNVSRFVAVPERQAFAKRKAA